MGFGTNFDKDKIKYLRLLSEKFPTRQSVCTEIINLMAIMNLPKGTEHFMSDIHGEYGAFNHILNNCSGVIKEKIELLYGESMSLEEKLNLRTLIYYPEEKLDMLKKDNRIDVKWYNKTLRQLIELSKLLSSKYTRSKVRKALPSEFAYVIDELLHAQKDEDNNRARYHEEIIDTIIGIDNADEFIIALCELIKRLAVDHLHIVGDIFDRGDGADRIIDKLMKHHSIDIEWGNHDILWMGAAAGSRPCIINVLRNNVRYDNTRILENAYGISLRDLSTFAERTYKGDPMSCMIKAINVLTFKLEGQAIKRHPEYHMDDRLLLDKIDYNNFTVSIDGKEYKLNSDDFPTVNLNDFYSLTDEEEGIVEGLVDAFKTSSKLHSHIDFLYAKGTLYARCNDNLLFHGCVPLDSDGNFETLYFDGNGYKGKALFDYADMTARAIYLNDNSSESQKDFMWYMWGGSKSPLCGRILKTFERTYIDDESTWNEPQDPYYKYYNEEATCDKILDEFGLHSDISHIINGHTPIRTLDGESPIRSGGKLIIIDGGFCNAYQKKTGIAGYTLIYNSHGMRLKSHHHFESVEKVLTENQDIESSSDLFETEKYRVMVGNTDNGKRISEQLQDLQMLLTAYRRGVIIPKE